MKARIEEVAKIVVDCGYHIHRRLGPGLFESVYESILAHSLSDRGLKIERQKLVEIKYDEMVFSEGFRADILVEDCLLLELKSVEALNPVHRRQLLTYLRLMNLPLGLLMNFGNGLTPPILGTLATIIKFRHHARRIGTQIKPVIAKA